MQFTVFGLLFLPFLLVTTGKPGRLLILAALAAVFDAASVANVNLGGFGLGVQPGFAVDLLFLLVIAVRYLAGQSFGNESRVIYLFLPIILFCIAAALSALILPRIFAGQVYVWPQRTTIGLENSSVPLYFGSGNITQLVYLLVNVALGVMTAAYVNVRPDFGRRLRDAYLMSGILVSVIGLWQWISKGSGIFYPTDFFFSNPNWADNTNQTFASTSIYRISGPFAEPSFLCFYLSGVIYGSFWQIVSTGPTRLAVVSFVASLAIAFLSTSTTGYAAVALGIPLLALFSGGSLRKWLNLAGIWALALPLLLVAAIVVWHFFPKLVSIGAAVLHDTLDKGNSESYEGRSQLDRETFAVVWSTFGLGAGWGSVRASSLLSTVVGATGFWGPALIAWFALRLRTRMRRLARSGERSLAQTKVMESLMASVIGMIVAAAVAKPDLIFSGFWLNLGASAGLALAVPVLTRARRASELSPQNNAPAIGLASVPLARR